MTRIRLPTTPIPGPTPVKSTLKGPIPGLMGLILVRDAAELVGDQVRSLAEVCSGVVVVDDGSRDGSQQAAEAAGARVLRWEGPRGEGAALRAGMVLARELGAIGALVLSDELLCSDALVRLAVAHRGAPEAMILAVGPGEAIAGKEWEEAQALARGEEPQPYPDYRPPKAPGLPGRVEQLFEAAVETRFSRPWGGVRILPLQAALRRPVRAQGRDVHMELLALAVLSGIPTLEVEVDPAPPRPVVTCKRACGRLLARLGYLLARRRVQQRMGQGGGYAPPTTSPLAIALAASLSVVVATLGTGCQKAGGPQASAAPCETDLPRSAWPGGGQLGRARSELQAGRAALPTYWVENQVRMQEEEGGATQTMRGVFLRDGPEKVRVRLVAGFGMTALDYLEVEGSWQLNVPMVGLRRSGEVGEPVDLGSLNEKLRGAPMQPELLSRLGHLPPTERNVRWQPGACAVIEVLDAEGKALRRLGLGPNGDSWVVVRDQYLERGEAFLEVRFSDYRPVDAGHWPFSTELVHLATGARMRMSTRTIRTDTIDPKHFLLRGGS